jgi:hypothetical protein
MAKAKPSTIPNLRTDEEAEDFIARDLSTLDFSKMIPISFDLTPQSPQ